MHDRWDAAEPSLDSSYAPASDRRPARERVTRVSVLSDGGLGFFDGAGRFWRVVIRRAPDAEWVRGPRYLLFESNGIARRVWTVPEDWRAMSALELETLSLQR
jgi:hypothetical protein